MDVAGKMQELFFGCDPDGFIYSLKQWADAAVFFIEIHRVSGKEGSHKVINRGWLCLLYEKVKVIGHEAVRDKGDGFGEIIQTKKLENLIFFLS